MIDLGTREKPFKLSHELGQTLNVHPRVLVTERNRANIALCNQLTIPVRIDARLQNGYPFDTRFKRDSLNRTPIIYLEISCNFSHWIYVSVEIISVIISWIVKVEGKERERNKKNISNPFHRLILPPHEVERRKRKKYEEETRFRKARTLRTSRVFTPTENAPSNRAWGNDNPDKLLNASNLSGGISRNNIPCLKSTNAE